MIDTKNSLIFSKARRKGFTLVELLVVMFIIATLAAITSTWAYKAYKRSQLSAKTLQYQQLFVANESYVVENGGAVCPAKNQQDGVWLQILDKYISSEKTKAYVDPFYRNATNSNMTGFGMSSKILLPESDIANKELNDTFIAVSMSEITFPGRRIFMGDCSTWEIKDGNADTTRHEENDENGDPVEKGMFLFFDGQVRLLTASEADKASNDPESLEF